MKLRITIDADWEDRGPVTRYIIRKEGLSSSTIPLEAKLEDYLMDDWHAADVVVTIQEWA